MGYAAPGTNPTDLIALAQHAERLGYDSAWAAEAWGTDAVSVLAWLAAVTERIKIGSAIMQIPARTPAATAMTAATLDLMSGGRFVLGLGTSGPQVVEGWHGQEWGKPLARTREYVEIVRAALRREQLVYDGEHYRLGDPALKLMLRPLRAEIPIYLAAMSPKAVTQTAEIADGWLPLFYVPEKARELFPAPFERGDLEIAASVPALVSDDVQAARDALKGYYAFYIGSMGSRKTNFYNQTFARYGYEREAAEIQELALNGRQRDAAALIPDSFVDEAALVGPKERMAERIAAFRESGATTLLISTRDPATLEAVAEAAA
jgi:F420-dependent oxidoreductase-like protein